MAGMTVLAALLCLLTAGNPLDAAIARAMAGRTGAVVVLDARTGRVVAQHRPDLARRTFARPGSVIKPFTLAALLDSGRVSATTALACPGKVRIGTHKLDCSHPETPAPLAPDAALAYSCNHFFTTVASRLNATELAHALEPAGRVVLSSDGEQLALQAIGEANVAVSPLRLAEAYRSLALRLAHDVKLAPVLAGLEGCVRYGTGQLAATPRLQVAGKTGTAADRGAPSHAWFAGFAPARDPQIVVVVFLQRGQGGADAAPVAREVFRAWQESRGPGYTVRLYWAHPPAGKPPQTIRLTREEYVAAALAGEATVLRSDEALKAMAVAARTYAHRFAGRHAKEGFDFCDTTHCQDIRLAAVNDRVRRAAAATEGEMLWYDGEPAATYYHLSCGGVLEDDSAAPYLRSHRDPWCLPSPWRAMLAKPDIARALRIAGFDNASARAEFAITARTGSGRAQTVRFGKRSILATTFQTAIGQALGWDLLRSTLYDARDAGGSVSFEGRGAGHGIGLCQTGADAMGAAGKSYRDILAYYYPATTLGRSAGGFRWTRLTGERAEVWTTREAAEPALVDAADRAVREAERRTGIPIAARPQFRFFPTVAVFRDATGESGAVAAITRGSIVRLQPPRILRAKNVLASTMLHEALHVAIESRAQPGLPLWFREGLAQHLSGGLADPRLTRLIAEHGLERVIGYLATGLPPEAAQLSH